MVNDALKKTFNDTLKLYSLPQTLAEVIRVVSDDNSSADDLAGVLMKDPALTTKVLRVVNSPFYGVGRQIGTVSQAVVTLGMRQVTALALSTSIYGMTEKWQSQFDRMRFWRHSLEVAIAARSIGEKIGVKNLEEIFVAGLLHDIGLLVIEQSFPDQFAKVWKQSLRRGGLADLEEEAWGTNHARVGQFMLEQWQLPESICMAVGAHHNVFTPGNDDQELRGCQIINLANRISHLRVADRQPGQETPDTESREIIRENLSLKVEDLISIEKRLLSLVMTESQYLEIDIGSAEDMLVEANRILFDQYAAVEALLEDNRRMQQRIAGEQVKTGFLESFKATASAFTRYLDRAAGSILQKIAEVRSGIERGAIVDPDGLVSDTARGIEQQMQALESVMDEMKKLTQTESAMYYDQGSIAAVEDRIEQEIKRFAEPASVS
jgi:putative nucleotidyltransferase with HDIG domain